MNSGNGKKLLVHYFRNNTGPALPPFSYQRPIYNSVADSTFYLEAPFSDIYFSKEGFYQVTGENPAGNGFCISVLHEGYPEIKTADQLVYPLRYLTTKTEYYSLDTARNKKKGVDEFWLNCSGSQERARELIRQYYNRVSAANRLFTSEREGWKTDRGMIYLVFGPPGNVYRSANAETWMYGNETGVGNLTFTFDRTTANILSQDEFVLERNEAFQVIWLQAVDSWRQGHVFNMQ
jgi:GWxTD domain-containing protein